MYVDDNRNVIDVQFIIITNVLSLRVVISVDHWIVHNISIICCKCAVVSLWNWHVWTDKTNNYRNKCSVTRILLFQKQQKINVNRIVNADNGGRFSSEIRKTNFHFNTEEMQPWLEGGRIFYFITDSFFHFWKCLKAHVIESIKYLDVPSAAESSWKFCPRKILFGNELAKGSSKMWKILTPTTTCTTSRYTINTHEYI